MIAKSKLIHISQKKMCGDNHLQEFITSQSVRVSYLRRRNSGISVAMNNVKGCGNPCSPIYKRTPGKLYLELRTKHKIVENIIFKCPHLHRQISNGKAALLMICLLTEWKGPAAERP